MVVLYLVPFYNYLLSGLVFLFYYVWGFFIYIVFFFKGTIEYFYVKYNNTSTIFKRDFNELSYFEKLFLTLFYRKNIFSGSIANIYTNNNLIEYRKSKYPLIFFFHLYFDRFNYSLNDLKKIIKQYNYFYNSKIFKKTFLYVKKLFFFKRKGLTLSSFMVFLIFQSFFFKRYYNLCSSIYFKNLNTNNLVKLNWLFFLFLTNSKGLLRIYDLSKYGDWYDFNFKNLKKQKPFTLKKKNSFRTLKVNFDTNKKNYLKKIYKVYDKFLKAFVRSYKGVNYGIFRLDKTIFNNIFLDKKWLNNLKLFYPVRFSETSLLKHIKLNNIKNYNFFYIRKNKIFNKGRYSRNRQLYRTGVYWCLWLNIMLVYGLYFMFYRFTFNFGYFWWGMLILGYSTIFSRILKYNFFNIFYLKSELHELISWLGLLLVDLKKNTLNAADSIINNSYIKNIFFNNSNFLGYLFDCMFYIYLYIREFLAFKYSGKFIYLWESVTFEDNSLLKYKSIVHWFTQLYKLLTF